MGAPEIFRVRAEGSIKVRDFMASKLNFKHDCWDGKADMYISEGCLGKQ
jgi:hypothetical protein